MKLIALTLVALSLATLFHEEAVFVHMGGTMSRSQELEVIRSGGIHYKHAEIQEASVRFSARLPSS